MFEDASAGHSATNLCDNCELLYSLLFVKYSHGIVIKHLSVSYLLFCRPAQHPNMGAVLSFVTGFVAPVFIIVSPVTSYADQIAAIYRSKSSAGFSLDIPLIMLVASILRYVLLTTRLSCNPYFEEEQLHLLILDQCVLLSRSKI
jgi:hypothetical protein